MKETVDFVINEICDRLKPGPLPVLPPTVPLSEPGCCLPLGLFTPVDKCRPGYEDEDLCEKIKNLEQILKDFDIHAEVNCVSIGSSVNRYELELGPGMRINEIMSLADDLAFRLEVPAVRMIPRIKGKAVIGIEVPNGHKRLLHVREILDDIAVRDNHSLLCVGIGKDVDGKVVTINMEQIPHLLITGTVGSGKSVCIDALLTGLMYKALPNEVKFILIDTEVVNLAKYNGSPYMYKPVITDVKEAVSTLKWAVNEMEQRVELLKKNNVADFKAYNQQTAKHMMPIVIVVNELKHIMRRSRLYVEMAIDALAQKGHVCGIHMVVATKQLTEDVITDGVRENIPSRMAFAVSSRKESQLSLGTDGAEKLIGKGDMLYYPAGAKGPLRVQVAYISDEEVNRVAEYVKKQAEKYPMD